MKFFRIAGSTNNHSICAIAALSAMLLVSTTLAGCAPLIENRIKESEERYAAQVEEMKRKAEAKGKVVYAIKDISEGAKMEATDFEERELEQAKIPQDAITSASLAAGRVAKYGIATGQIVSQHDIASYSQRNSVRVNLSKEQHKKLEELAKKESKNPEELVKSWVDAKLAK